MLIFLMVLIASLALSFVVTRFFVNILKQIFSQPSHNNILVAFKKPPHIYLIAGILFLIFFKLMFHVLTFISLGL